MVGPECSTAKVLGMLGNPEALMPKCFTCLSLWLSVYTVLLLGKGLSACGDMAWSLTTSQQAYVCGMHAHLQAGLECKLGWNAILYCREAILDALSPLACGKDSGAAGGEGAIYFWAKLPSGLLSWHWHACFYPCRVMPSLSSQTKPGEPCDGSSRLSNPCLPEMQLVDAGLHKSKL